MNEPTNVLIANVMKVNLNKKPVKFEQKVVKSEKHRFPMAPPPNGRDQPWVSSSGEAQSLSTRGDEGRSMSLLGLAGRTIPLPSDANLVKSAESSEGCRRIIRFARKAKRTEKKTQ